MTLEIPVPADFSFSETLSAHGWRWLLPFVWNEEAQTLQRVEELQGGGIARLSLRDRNGAVEIEMGEEADAEEIIRRVRRMLQLDLSLGEFHAFCQSHLHLASLAEYRKGRMLRSPTLWEDVVKVIATTNTTWAQTIAMTARLVENFGAEGRAFPGPERIAALSFDEFAAGARMGYRSAYVYRIAAEIADGRMDLEAWQETDSTAEELRKRLLSLPGIGPYGAACLMLYLGKPRHVNADSWARTLLTRELGKPVTDQEVTAYFETYGDWRGLVYMFYPWQNKW